MNKKTLLEIFAVAGIFCLAGCEKKAYAQSSNQVAKIPLFGLHRFQVLMIEQQEFRFLLRL